MRRICAAGAIIMTLALCGCSDKTELGDRAIIQAAAIDFDNGTYRVSALMFSGGGGSDKIDSSQDNVIKISGEGDTVGAAIENISQVDGKKVYMSETKLLVFGAGFEDADIISALNTLYYDRQCSLNMPVCCSETAELLTDIRFKEGVTSAEKPVSMIENGSKSGFTPKTTVFDILCDNAGNRTSLIPRFEEGFNGYGMSDDEDGRTVLLSGSAVVNKGKLSGYADAAETVGLLILNGETDSLPINVSAHGNEIACEAYGIKAQPTNGSVNITASFRRLNGEPLSESASAAAGDLLKGYILAALDSGLFRG